MRASINLGTPKSSNVLSDLSIINQLFGGSSISGNPEAPRISDLDELLEDFGSAGKRVPKPTAGYISWQSAGRWLSY